MNTSHQQVKKPRYPLSLYLNPGNNVVHFSGWRKLSFFCPDLADVRGQGVVPRVPSRTDSL